MRGYKYIKFTKSMAKVNPELIDKAYIEEIKAYEDHFNTLNTLNSVPLIKNEFTDGNLSAVLVNHDIISKHHNVMTNEINTKDESKASPFSIKIRTDISKDYIAGIAERSIIRITDLYLSDATIIFLHNQLTDRKAKIINSYSELQAIKEEYCRFKIRFMNINY